MRNEHEELKGIASQITRKRTRVSILAAIVGAVVTVVLIVALGGLVYLELHGQNERLEGQLELNRSISQNNREILEAARRTEQRLAEQLLEEAKRNRQQLRAMRQQHNEILRLVRGIVRAAGRPDLLEGLPGPGGDQRPSRER